MPSVRQRGRARRTHAGVSEQIGLSLGGAVRSLGGCQSFRYFISSPEVIRLTMMVYVRDAQLPGPALARLGTLENLRFPTNSPDDMLY
jgi:hypothetical protein